jgi:hypothetical protein
MFNLCVEGREHNLAIALAQCHLLKLEVRYCRLLKRRRLPGSPDLCCDTWAPRHVLQQREFHSHIVNSIEVYIRFMGAMIYHGRYKLLFDAGRIVVTVQWERL